MDYTEQLNIIINHLSDTHSKLIEMNESLINAINFQSYLILFLSGCLVAVGLIIILKGLK